MEGPKKLDEISLNTHIFNAGMIRESERGRQQLNCPYCLPPILHTCWNHKWCYFALKQESILMLDTREKLAGRRVGSTNSRLKMILSFHSWNLSVNFTNKMMLGEVKMKFTEILALGSPRSIHTLHFPANILCWLPTQWTSLGTAFKSGKEISWGVICSASSQLDKCLPTEERVGTYL